MKYFKLHNKEMPWGDYGHILFRGWNDRDDTTGQFIVERTAPSMPRIWRDISPWLFAVDDMKKMLEQSGLRGLSFQPAIKKRIVLLDWMKWDMSAPDPQVYPAGGEPENYILRRQHNQKLSDEIGEIWAVIPSNQGLEIKYDPKYTCSQTALIAQSLGDADFLVPANTTMSIYVSEKAKDWLLQNGIDDVYAESEPIPIREASATELETIHAEMEYYRLRKEWVNKMTNTDWQKYYRLTGEARKLAKTRLEAKSEVVKARRTAKAIANLLEAKEIYPFSGPYDDEERLLAELQK